MPKLSIHSRAFPEREPDPQRPGEYIMATPLYNLGNQLAEAYRLGQLKFTLDLPFLSEVIEVLPDHQTILLGLGVKPDQLVIELGVGLSLVINKLVEQQPELAALMGAGWMQRYQESNQRGG